MEIDRVDGPKSQSDAPTCGSAITTNESRSTVQKLNRATGSQRPVRVPPTLLVYPIALAVTFGLASVGIITNNAGAVSVGLAGAAAAASVLTLVARSSIRAQERRLNELRVAYERLQQRNAELETQELALEEALEWIDDQTQGRLRELIEDAGDELAALVDAVLDAPRTGHED